MIHADSDILIDLHFTKSDSSSNLFVRDWKLVVYRVYNVDAYYLITIVLVLRKGKYVSV